MLKTFEEMCDDESICSYCHRTDYGEHKSCHTPSGIWMCEGAWCDDSYKAYLEDNDATGNLVKYQNAVKLLNEEELHAHANEV